MSNLPKLFSLSNSVQLTDVCPLSFSTPLGRLKLELQVCGVSIAPATTFQAGNQSVTVWPAPYSFEILLTRPPTSLPPDMAVEGAMAAVWRANATQPTVIKCQWESGATWSEVGPESGENLDAQSWTDGRTKVTVGLPDYESATTYQHDGFAVAVNSVAAKQGHFIWAWGPDSPDDISTWFAVDWPTAQLLRSARVS